MTRLGAALITVCMVLVAASLGAVLYLSASLSGIEAAVVAIAVLTALVVYNTSTTRARDRADVSGQIADLARGTIDLARQVGEIGRRMEGVEGAAAVALDKTRATAEPLAAEIATLGTLVKQLAESVAAHAVALAQAAAERANAAERAVERSADARTRGASLPAAAAESGGMIDPGEFEETIDAAPATPRFGDTDGGAIAAMMVSAIEGNRLDL